ncbi:hypothetical protein F2Q68_00013786 [Brassica cretica]|uniref:Uncharacterized protein n=1 Tax=Brassica cretica TaxID=69181 RepID=A0A8S9HC12_BRACR|nr:hypothetical protein F2Q68_00013786 [Brassica cretica]
MASDLGTSLREVALGVGSDLRSSLRDVAPGLFLHSKSMKWRATSARRSGKVALRGRAQRVHGVAPVGRSHALLVQ